MFILNTASPWIIHERLTAPQHTRFILPLTSSDKIHRYAAWAVFFFYGKRTLKISWADRTWYRLSVNAAAQTGAGTSFGANGDPHTWAGPPLLIFCVLTIRKHLLKMRFERSGRGQEPSRGHKFSILENLAFHWDFTSSMRLHFRSDLVGACLPQTLLERIDRSSNLANDSVINQSLL